MSPKDGIHPNSKGHKIMADLAVWLFQQTAIDLMMRPYHESEAEMQREAMPAPMMEGKIPTLLMRCSNPTDLLLQFDVNRLLSVHPGFASY